MAKSNKTPNRQTNGLAVFQAHFLATPAGEHLALHFWQAQEGILKETEEFMKSWFQRRHEAAHTALRACADTETTTPQNPASVAQTIATWQSLSMQRIAEDALDCTNMMSRCTTLLLNTEAEATKELMEDAATSTGKTANAIPV